MKVLRNISFDKRLAERKLQRLHNAGMENSSEYMFLAQVLAIANKEGTRPRKHVDSRVIETKQIEGEK